jgi:putative transposase
MARRGKHSNAEIAAKLARADELGTQGKLQEEIARTLGVSVMTLHRWRKAAEASGIALGDRAKPRPVARALHRGRVAELQQENELLRKLVTDLLLEKMKLGESLQAGNFLMRPVRRR